MASEQDPRDDRSGISNKPLEEEEARQERLPPEGTARGGTEPRIEPRPDEKPPPRDPAPKQRRPKSPPPNG